MLSVYYCLDSVICVEDFTHVARVAVWQIPKQLRHENAAYAKPFLEAAEIIRERYPSLRRFEDRDCYFVAASFELSPQEFILINTALSHVAGLRKIENTRNLEILLAKITLTTI